MGALPNTPFDLPNPGLPAVPSKTLTRWDTFIGDIASGMPLADAMLKTYISRADIETMCRLDDGGMQKQRWEEAERAGRKRAWTVFELKDIFGFIAEGKTIKDAQLAAVGKFDPTFSRLLVDDPDMNAQYRKALEARSLTVVEEIIGIVDDDSRDTLETAKGPIPNMAAVSRDKLKSETRLRVAGAWNTKLYGEKKDNVQVNVQINHAERLEEARTRAQLKDKRVTPKQMQAAIDATFSEKTVDNDTAWMDEKPADSQWREET
jgi:hypothetical protein